MINEAKLIELAPKLLGCAKALYQIGYFQTVEIAAHMPRLREIIRQIDPDWTPDDEPEPKP